MRGYRLATAMNIWSPTGLPNIGCIAAGMAVYHQIGLVALGLWTVIAAVKAFLVAGQKAACRELGWKTRREGRTEI